jgi:formamidopyrimidine-DNA glycosylase
MPELPEVEIWRENLERWLKGRRITSAHVPDRILRGRQPRRKVEAEIEGATIRGVARRGKFLVLDLGRRRSSVLVHLGMTGSFERVPRHGELPRFTRVHLGLSHGERLAFLDARRLGEFRLVTDKEKRRLDALGIEPLTRELTMARLFTMTHKSTRPIKIFLMDQKRIAGIGNIHAAEILFLAGIHPERDACELSRDDCSRLVRAIRRELRFELARSRSEKLRYLQQGEENRFRVYGHAGEPCPRCATPLAKLVQAGRSSYYCSQCQPKQRKRK